MPGASAGSAAPRTPLGLQPPRKFYCSVCITSHAAVGAVFMVWLCCDSCISVNSERGKKNPAVRAVCFRTPAAGLAATGPGCFLQDLAAADGTSQMCRRRKSLALPENAGQRKILPPAMGAHVFSCQHGHYGEQRGASCSGSSVQSTQVLTALSGDTMPPRWAPYGLQHGRRDGGTWQGLQLIS